MTYKTHIAIQFWVLSKFVTSIIAIPIIEWVLLPMVYIFSRRVFIYAWFLEYAEFLIRFPKILQIYAGLMPQIIGRVYSSMPEASLTPLVRHILEYYVYGPGLWILVLGFVTMTWIAGLVMVIVQAWWLRRSLRKHWPPFREMV